MSTERKAWVDARTRELRQTTNQAPGVCLMQAMAEWNRLLLIVELDTGSLTEGRILGRCSTVREYLEQGTDRDGARNPKLRLWRGSAPIGSRVSLVSR